MGRHQLRSLEAALRTLPPTEAKPLGELIAYGPEPLSDELARLWLMTGADPAVAQDLFPSMAPLWEGVRSLTLLAVARDTTTESTEEEGGVALRLTMRTAQQAEPLTLRTHWSYIPGATGGWRLTRIEDDSRLSTWLSGAPVPPHEERR